MEYAFRPRFAFAALALAFVVLFVTQGVRADELYGRIRGTVTDPSGAVVSAAKVRVTNTGTGIVKETTTDASGLYEFINLQVGNYTINISKQGFRTSLVSGVTLTQNQVYVNNVSLELGSIAEEVTITANAAQVEQASMQLTADIGAKTITDLPLIGRNFVTLQQTLPGVVLPDTRFGTNYSTNGSQAQQNSYLVNGNDFNDLPLNSPLAPPNPDTIEEVKMVTNTINPEFGRNSGAILNAVTKSGTNSFHGSAFEFYRDTFLNTKNFFAPQPVIHQNLYGGTIGGPIIKNKVFFLYGLQITRARQPGANFAGSQTVYTQDQLNGNWAPSTFNGFVTVNPDGSTKVTNPKSSPFPMFGDSASTCPVSGGTMCPAGTPYGQLLDPVTHDPIPGQQGLFSTGQVPTGDYNSLATTLVSKYVPLPNSAGNQFAFSPITQVQTNQHIGRLDWNIGQKDLLWFYAYANNSSTLNDLPFSGATIPGFGDTSVPWTKQFTVSWNHTLSSDILNELRLGYTRFNFKSGQPQQIVTPASVGFTNIFPQLANAATMPNIAITGYFTLGGTINGPQPRKDQTYQITDNFSWIKGKHSLKFGYDGRRFQVWNPFAARNSGAFSFTKSGKYSTFDPGANFLLGIPSSYNQQSGQTIIAEAYEHYLYFQDQWRVRSNLTLTFGTGYQVDTPLAEYQNGGLSRICFQPGAQSRVFPTAPPGYTLPGDPGCDKYGGASTKWAHFGPRLGFAFSPDADNKLTGGAGKMSIRGGIGVYFNRSEEELNLQDLGIPPFGLGSNGIGDAGGVPSFPDPWTNIATGASIPNKFPYVAPVAGDTSIDFTALTPFIVSVVDKNLTTPYSINYNLTIERELPAQTILRVGYVGAQGRKLLTSYTFNPTTPAGVAACVADPACNSDPDNQPVNGYPDHYKYDPLVWANSGIQRNGGWSNYNSLQVTVDKRFSHGLQFLSAYTWSHALDVSSSFEDTAFQAAGAFDPYGNLARDYGSSAFDARHRWVVSFSYDVPSLRRVWAAIPSRLVDGWRLTGINAYQSGFPINFQSVSENSLTCAISWSFYACPDRPDFVSTPKVLNPRTATFNGLTHYYFDPNSMTDNALGTLGNIPRGYFVGPGYWNADFSVQKDTKITESKFIQLRLEAYNLFNHTNFANPSGNVDSVNFGRITQIRTNTNSRLVQLGAKFIF